MTLDARLIAALRSARVHLLAGDLAAMLGVALPEVEGALGRLKEAGFEIETKPGLGCRLLRAPDRLIADDLYARLGKCMLAAEVIVFAETSSTNDVAAKLGREGHRGAAIFAERQTAGRGRFGRRWESEGGRGLWFSILMRPELPMAKWPRLTTWAGVAVAAAIERVMPQGTRVTMKWPNDIIVNGGKVSGILIESATDHAGEPFAVVGIGMNVNQTSFPVPIENSAASLRQLSGRVLDRAELAADVLRELEKREHLLAAEFPALVAEAERRSAVIGRWLQLSSGGEIIHGTAESLDAEGNLRLRMENGEVRTASAGEVTSHLEG